MYYREPLEYSDKTEGYDAQYRTSTYLGTLPNFPPLNSTFLRRDTFLRAKLGDCELYTFLPIQVPT